jgi:F-type H+-transporting ATPase subunit epsilon
MSKSLHLEIVTPEGRVFSDAVSEVVLPGAEGELGILPEHSHLLAQLAPGELRILRQGERIDLAVGSGLVEVTGSRVRVLTEMAVNVDHIDEQAAQAAIERAHEAMKTLSSSESDEIAAMAALIHNATAQIHVKRRHRRTSLGPSSAEDMAFKL